MERDKIRKKTLVAQVLVALDGNRILPCTENGTCFYNSKPRSGRVFYNERLNEYIEPCTKHVHIYSKYEDWEEVKE